VPNDQEPDTDSIFATVTDCQSSGTADIDVTVTIFQVVAKMYAPRNRYADDIYMVHILEPVGLDALLPKRGVPMDHEEFSFDATHEVPKGTKLKISVSRFA
jgi:hypothetical protein